MKLWLISEALELSDFSASDTLARSLWLGDESSAKSVSPRYLERALVDPFPALSIAFSGTMYREGDNVYIGRGLPLSREEDVIEVVECCAINPTSALLKSAVSDWKDLMTIGGPARLPDFVDKVAFDTYLRNKRSETDPDHEKLKAIESDILDWFRPRHVPGPQASSPGVVKAYCTLPGELQIIVLFLAYRLGTKHWAGLRRLVETRDWQYFARVINNPSRECSSREAASALRQIEACLLHFPEARKFVLDHLKSQPMVGHRALAEEYERISGIRYCKFPTDHIQDTMLTHVDREGHGLNAICLSGGGIRSASFCLGALQVLASHGLFGRFHYISTVSSGGYIGTALTRWMSAKQRDDKLTPEEALRFAEEELARLRSADYVRNRMTGTDFEEEGPLTWLRMNSNYLARRLALFSADAWTIVAVYLRNLFIVWIIFWPWISGFLLLPWFAVWLGQYKNFDFWISPTFWGSLGSAVGVLGATYSTPHALHASLLVGTFMATGIARHPRARGGASSTFGRHVRNREGGMPWIRRFPNSTEKRSWLITQLRSCSVQQGATSPTTVHYRPTRGSAGRGRGPGSGMGYGRPSSRSCPLSL
ncbi:patatin-like phospholipase family protein [Caballeronia sp. S22]|uniref:patatin-like phospholipase family protein n=1 Tax=Caballeronia sp. S22 TaxID=3137182 RepID=UPI003530DDA0